MLLLDIFSPYDFLFFLSLVLLLGSEDALRLYQPGREMKDSPCDRGSSEIPRGSRRAPLKQNQASKVQGNSPTTICWRFMYY